MRAARLVQVEQLLGVVPSPDHLSPPQLTPTQLGRSKCWAAENGGRGLNQKIKLCCQLASRVDLLTAGLGQMKDTFFAFHKETGRGGARTLTSLEVAELREYGEDTLFKGMAFHTQEGGSLSFAHSPQQCSEDNSVGAIIKMALAHLQLDMPQLQSALHGWASRWISKGAALFYEGLSIALGR